MVMVTDFLSVVQSPRFENLCRCKQGIRKCDSLLLFSLHGGCKIRNGPHQLSMNVYMVD